MESGVGSQESGERGVVLSEAKEPKRGDHRDGCIVEKIGPFAALRVTGLPSRLPTPDSRLPTLTEAFMPELASVNTRRGITVLALLLLIIALAVAGFFLVRYLRLTS